MIVARRAILFSPLLAAGAGTAAAVDFPTKPVSLIVPFPPGGATDLIGRVLGAALQRRWGQPVVVQNRGGAGGAIGMAAGAQAHPDGYTALIAHVSYSSIPASDALLGRRPSFNRSALEPVALLTADPLMIVVRADAPWRTWQELLEDAHRRPGAISYGSTGPYSAAHIPFEMLAQAGGVQFQHVPFSGAGPAITAVLGGHIATANSVPSVVAPQIASGQLRALVGTGSRRARLLQDVPTAMELGFGDVEFYLWVGLFTQAGVNPEIVARLREGVTLALEDPELQRQIQSTGSEIEHLDGDAFRDFLARDLQRVEAAVQRIGRVD